MAQIVKLEKDVRPGNFYEDAFFHPCVCIGVEEMAVVGISLVDGTFPRAAEIGLGNVRLLTLSEAWHWRLFGPIDREVPADRRWWRHDYADLSSFSSLELLQDLIDAWPRDDASTRRKLAYMDPTYVLTALETRTHQSFGTDLRKWMEWLEESGEYSEVELHNVRTLYKRRIVGG